MEKKTMKLGDVTLTLSEDENGCAIIKACCNCRVPWDPMPTPTPEETPEA